MSTSDPSAGRVAVDPKALEDLRKFGGDAMLQKLVMLYREQVEVRTAALRGALATGDMAAARQAAHALKSSSGQIGAVGLQELCKRTEHAAIDNDRDEVAACFAEFDGVITAVDRWLTDRGFPREL